MPSLALGVVAATALFATAVGDSPPDEQVDASRWVPALLVHLPFVLVVLFLAAGLVERLGYFRHGRAPVRPGRLPDALPTICVQLPMYDERNVARRAIEVVCALDWPAHLLEVQVLDDSTDRVARSIVDATCADMRGAGIDCQVVRRASREGYKAGALELGRRRTDADLIVIFDADFLPDRDYLQQVVPHFFEHDGRWIDDLALVQAQWGHLNHDVSRLTRAQALWVDDHHTVQMSWRSARWEFVNFTGTAGVWRARAIERAGGWRAASLVEDCELSFRHLFAGYRTRFVKEIVAPAELPATYTAYKAQQKRWTQGWVQLQKLHLRTLMFDYRTSAVRRLHLLYHMCIPWQWALWGLWLLVLPFAIWNGLWLGTLGVAVGFGVYVLPMVLWLLVASVVATVETRWTYNDGRSIRTLVKRLGRLGPYVLLNTGMLPHQFMAFNEGLFGALHTEFERTPKAATVTASRSGADDRAETAAQGGRQKVRVHRPYVVAEVFFACYQLGWGVLFATAGLWINAAAATVLAACVLGLMWFYGDHAGRRLLVFDVDTLPAPVGRPKRIRPGRVASGGWGRRR